MVLVLTGNGSGSYYRCSLLLLLILHSQVELQG